ncbi:PKHN1 protein, partial [Columbina picui]|nr:PKHN1 protein [Columbina picui]
QNGKKKLPSFFGMEGGQERDTTTDKILQYIPGKASTNSPNPCSHCSRGCPQPQGQRRGVLTALGSCFWFTSLVWLLLEVNDCFLELFQSYLYFQSVGSNGLTYQGLLPLKELNVCEIENGKAAGQEDHAFRIAGPLLNPLIVFCSTESELKQWLYHLEKQIQLNGGSLGLPFLAQ